MRIATLCLLLALCAPAFAQDAGQPVLAAAASADAPIAPAPSSYVVLDSGEMLRGTVEIMPSVRKAEYVLVNGQRYDLDDVAVFTTDSEAYGVARHPYGGQMLLRRASEGRISIFKDANAGIGGADFAFFQKDDERLQLLTADALRAAVSDNPESLRYLNRRDTYGKIGTAGFIAGAALVAAGAVIRFAEIDGPNPYTLAASGVGLAAGINLAVPLMQRSAEQQAIRAYNR